MFRRERKYANIIVGGIVVLLAAVSGYFLWLEVGVREQSVGQNDFYEAVNAERERLIEEQKNDTQGGNTPEETWNMFIAALESGDVAEASGYFVVGKQEEMRKQFEAGMENGAVDAFLNEDVSRITGSEYYESGKTFEFYTDEINNGPGFVYVLVLNEYTDVWKIESL